MQTQSYEGSRGIVGTESAGPKRLDQLNRRDVAMLCLFARGAASLGFGDQGKSNPNHHISNQRPIGKSVKIDFRVFLIRATAVGTRGGVFVVSLGWVPFDWLRRRRTLTSSNRSRHRL